MTANPFAWSFRAQYLAASVACYALIGYALYVQMHMLMLPCPLCILQRIAFAALGAVFLVGGLHAPTGGRGRACYGVLAAIFAAIGAFIAGSHIRLQLLPPGEAALCNNMGLEYMVEAMGPLKALATVLKSAGECTKVDWTFLGLSMPVWTLAWYVGLGVFALWAAFRRR
jgi:disulfide bond formation protein DsbB